MQVKISGISSEMFSIKAPHMSILIIVLNTKKKVESHRACVKLFV